LQDRVHVVVVVAAANESRHPNRVCLRLRGGVQQGQRLLELPPRCVRGCQPTKRRRTMAINWTEYEPNSRDIKRTWVTDAGRVVSEPWTREVRAMSDVYCNASYVRVWNPETKTSETVCLGYQFECNSTYGHAVVDADEAVLRAVALQDEAERVAREQAEKARREDEARKVAEAAFNLPALGKVMQVVRGRKVRKGTVGRVFWLDDPRNPTRVGLATSSRKDAKGLFANVAWVNAEYLVNCDPAGPDYAAYGC
jgi:hypothetical protein